MSGLCMAGGGHFVSRSEVAEIIPPAGTNTWCPLKHGDLINAVLQMVDSRGWTVTSEDWGLARNDLRLFGVIRLARSSSPDWQYAIAVKNGNDKAVACSIAAGLNVYACSNLSLSGDFIISRRHTAGLSLDNLLSQAVDVIDDSFIALETTMETLRCQEIRGNDEARACLVKAAESHALNSSDIVEAYREYRNPRHFDFEPSRYNLLQAVTQVNQKYPVARYEASLKAVTKLFGLNGHKPELWK